MNPGESTTKSFPGTAPPPERPGAITLADTQTVAAPADRVLVRLRWAVIAALCSLLVLIVVRLALVDGLLRRVTIEGPSMAPALVGAHHRVTCGDCGFVFRCDATDVPTSGLAVCPNCGYRANELTAANLQSGQRVLIDRWKLLFGGPERGEVVAARQPGSKEGLVVKRVAALPGERLEIREGDLYVQEKIVRKSLAELHAVRVLVHDNAFAPQATPNLPARWQAARANSLWRGQAGSFQIAAPSAAQTAADFDWLEYHHWRCSESSAPRTKTVPILDNDSFNQNVSRQLNPVTDVMLSCRLQGSGKGQIALVVLDGTVRHEAVIDPDRKLVSLLEDGRQILEKRLGADLTHQPTDVEFGLCDEQVLLAVAGRTVLKEPYQRQTGSRPDVLRPLEIGVRDLTARVSHLKVWRDLHYLEPLGTSRPWQAEQPLASGEFALLGDNPPVSIDARHWPGSGGISRSQMLGPVIHPFWASAD